MVAISLPAPARARVPRRAPSAGVRRRRRQLAAVVVAGLAASVVWTLWGVASWLGSGPLAAPEPVSPRMEPAAAVVHLVQPGDTLWSIARSAQPGGEIRPLVDALVAQTHGRPLQVGDRLVLP